jgi:uncharacterized membrane protein (DUF2068 family)
MDQQRTRPVGVTLLSALGLAGAIVLSWLGSALLTGGGVSIGSDSYVPVIDTGDGVAFAFVPLAGAPDASPLRATAVVLGGASLVLGLAHLVFAWGNWTLRGWAWWLGVALGAVVTAWSWNVFLDSTTIADSARHGTAAVVSAVVLLSLFSDRVQRAFGRTPRRRGAGWRARVVVAPSNGAPSRRS